MKTLGNFFWESHLKSLLVVHQEICIFVAMVIGGSLVLGWVQSLKKIKPIEIYYQYSHS